MKFEKFNNVNEAIEDLKNLGRVDFKTETNREVAMEHCKKIMTNVFKSSHVFKTAFEKGMYSQTLKDAGCCKWDDANDALLDKNTKSSIGESMSEKGTMTFAFSALTQLVDSKLNTFSFGFSKLVEGDEHSWTYKWLEAQDAAPVETPER